jgi:[acyl-carrier-protein] S-malonyltransferase
VRLAFLFPGQGSQAVGMGRALAAEFREAREVFERADEVLGFALSRLCWEGPAEELKLTHNAQPALLAHSIAALRVVEGRSELRPEWTAGHSLGEYSACVAAGALELEVALRLVRLRGELMHRADPAREGTMAAVLGVDPPAAERVCREAAPAGTVVAANLNAPGQVVLSGQRRAVEVAARLAEAQGAKRVVMLEVSGAFHSPLMEPAGRDLARALDEAPFRDARCAIVANTKAGPVRSAGEIRAALKEQLTSPVRWQASMEWLRDAGAGGFVELGTGRVLRGLLRSIDRGLRGWSIEDPATLEAALGELGGVRLAKEGA